MKISTKFKLLSILFIALLNFNKLNAQTVVNQPTTGNQNITDCIVTFNDNGGNTGNYANNVNSTTTFFPATPGTYMSISFNSISIENNVDFIYIYDGLGTTAPLIGTYTGSVLPPLITASNPQGILTVQFVSDNANVNIGWNATVTCIVPCPISDVKAITIPGHQNNGQTNFIEVCKNQNVSLKAYCEFLPNTDTNNVVYSWTMGDGVTYNTRNVNHSYPNTGIYTAIVTARDTVLDCYNKSTYKIFVAQDPNFDGTGAIMDSICQWDTMTLYGFGKYTMIRELCNPPTGDTTFLPDGSGVSYTSSINIDCYDPSTNVVAASDIERIYINMEHSYLGDLEMRIICPNNQSAVLKQYPGGGGTFLGGPNDPGVGNMVPGIGWEYGFKSTAVWGTMLEQDAIAGFTVPNPNIANQIGNALPQGDYKPFQSYNNLIGCPLNGTWTIQITDNLGSDNGYIFYWGMNINDTIPTLLDSFINHNVDSFWNQSLNIVQANGNMIKVKANDTGTNCFTYSVINNYGCTYDTTVCFYVKAAPQTVLYDSICIGQNSFGYTVAGTYIDTFEAANGCDSLRILNLFIRPEAELVDLGPDRIVCQYDSVWLEPNILPNRGDYMYDWMPITGLDRPNEANVFLQADQTITYILSVRPPLGCVKSDTITITVNPGDFGTLNVYDTAICPNNSIQLVAGGGIEYRWSPDLNITGININNPIVTPNTTTDYKAIIKDLKGCYDTVTAHIEVYPQSVLNIPDTIFIYNGETYTIEPQTNATHFEWYPRSGLSAYNIANPNVTTDVNTRYFISARTENGCVVNDTLDIIVKDPVIDMPNAFNPNDGMTFKPNKRGIHKLISFQVFDRWGKIVYETTDIEKGWDGRVNGVAQPGGVYVYQISAETSNGTKFNKTGNVTLIR